jgi:hypothetical protein
MQAEHFVKHEDRSPDRGAYADLTNFHAGCRHQRCAAGPQPHRRASIALPKSKGFLLGPRIGDTMLPAFEGFAPRPSLLPASFSPADQRQHGVPGEA